MNDTLYPATQMRLSDVAVQTVSGRGWSPEEIAQRALDKIVQVSDTAPSPIREQAMAYREAMRGVLVHYLREAVHSDRTTIANKLVAAGHPELLHILRG